MSTGPFSFDRTAASQNTGPLPGATDAQEDGGFTMRHSRFARLALASLLALGTFSAMAEMGVTSAGASGTWRIISSPNGSTAGSVKNDLTGVSCISTTWCQAVGTYGPNLGGGPGDKPLAELWNGTKWSLETIHGSGTMGSSLAAVSCVSTTACMAVGSYTTSTDYRNLIESWNGTMWSVVPSPDLASGDNQITGVSCISASSCTAVGYYDSNNVGSFVESWNGSKWSIVTPSSPTATGDLLYGVSCISTSSCTAVGYKVGYNNETVIESLKGGTWTVVPSPDPGKGSNELLSVSCTSATHCTAVGNYLATHNGFAGIPLIESWNGTTWTVVPGGTGGATSGSYLSAVSCHFASSCVAAGEVNGNGPTLIESWNGIKWTIVPSPSTSSKSDLLNAVSCPLAASCTAVGVNLFGTDGDTLVESDG
jgi:hypothetical protein